MPEGWADLELKTPGELLDDIVRLRKALQRIADLPEPEHLTRAYKRSPQQIAIAALKWVPPTN